MVFKNNYNKDIGINTSMIQTAYETKGPDGEFLTVFYFDDSGNTVKVKGTLLEVATKINKGSK